MQREVNENRGWHRKTISRRADLRVEAQRKRFTTHTHFCERGDLSLTLFADRDTR